MKFSFKGNLVLDSKDLCEEFFVQSDSVRDLEIQIIDKALEFANEHDGELPSDYICDWMDPSMDDEDDIDNTVYVEYKESNAFDEDNFYTTWDNYIKGLSRGRL